MRILIVAPYISSTYGGPSRVVTELARELAQAGISVDLVTTNSDVDRVLEVPVNVWVEQEGYRARFFDCWLRHDLIWSSSFTGWLFQHVHEYDVVHTHCLFMPLATATHWICRFRRVSYVMTPHGMLEPWALAHKAWKKKLYYTAIEKPALRRAKAIHVLTPVEAAQVQALGFQHTIVVPNGTRHQEFEHLPDPEIFYQQFPETRDKRLILFLGRIDPKKGLDLLAAAFAKVYHCFPQAHLVVAGPDSIGFLTTVRQFFAEVNCLETVTFTGMLTGELKQSALAAATLYVAPSYSEGFSMSVLEGMASGLPCTITEGCNFPEAAQAGVATVVKPNSDAIAQALIRHLAQPEAAKTMGVRARQFMFQHYTWERIARQLIQHYTRIRMSTNAEC